MFRQDLEKKVLNDIANCIGCNECMRVCPVSKSDALTIPLLNEPIMNNSIPKGIVKDFALNCVQCGKCVPVCPPGVRRDLLVLYLKANIQNYPSNYESYVRLKQPHPPAAAKALYSIKRRTSKKSLGDLYNHCDPDTLRQADILFYPGCYIYNEICHKTTAILKYLKEDFEVLGGYTTCCGWPQYLQGRMEMADEFLEFLWQKIQKVNPRLIITSCAECFAALQKLKAIKQADFIPLTTTEYFYQNLNRLPLIKNSKKSYGFHDSCHISRKYFRDEVPRELLSKLGNVKELQNNRENSMCCYYYNFHNDEKNEENRDKRIEEVKNCSDIMVTDCITCYEVFKENKRVQEENIEVIDFNDLIYHCINLPMNNSDKSIPNMNQEGL